MNASRWILLAALAGAGCAHAPREYVFDSPKPISRSTAEVLAGSLAHQGHQVAAVDPDKGEILTYWEDTRYRFRETDDQEDETSVFLRYRVQFRPGDSHVTVSAEAQRCVPYRAVVTRTEVQSTCIKMDRIFGTQQRAVEQLGQSLAASLASAS
jgi:hypothetical protein